MFTHINVVDDLFPSLTINIYSYIIPCVKVNQIRSTNDPVFGVIKKVLFVGKLSTISGFLKYL